MAAFGLSLAGSFHFDDYALFNTPSVTAWTATRPLTNLTFKLNEWAGGQDPAGYHLVNLALHLAAVLLLHLTLAAILPRRAALLAAGIFAVHPILAEPVNYVFARGTLLSTLLCIASLHAWLRDRRWTAVLWFAAAMLTKEEAVAFPIFLFLLDASRHRFRAGVAPLAAMLALALAAGLRVLTATAQVQGAAVGFTAHTGPFEYLAAQGVVILRYWRMILLPWGFTVDPEIAVPAMWIRVGAWALILAAILLATRWWSNLRAGFWFIGSLLLLLPSSSIFPADDLAADRRMYLPVVALCAALGILLAHWKSTTAQATVIILLAAISVRQSLIWRTEQSLWADAVSLAPHKARPRLWLSRSAASRAGALAILAEAQSIAPGDPAVASEQGRILLGNGRTAEALQAYGRALALAPGDPVALSNRGAALAALGQTDPAIQDFTRALEKNPCLFNARINLKRITGRLPPAQGCPYTQAEQDDLSH